MEKFRARGWFARWLRSGANNSQLAAMDDRLRKAMEGFEVRLLKSHVQDDLM